MSAVWINIYLLRGGIEDWKDLGGKLENSDVLLGFGAKWADFDLI